jgi:hypothetical protein
MDFEELLARYKDNPRRESTALLLTDPVLLKYCVIWKQVTVERLVGWVPGEPSWTALWDCVSVPIEQIAMLADDELGKARKNVERIKGLRLVYPDGTVQDLVNKVITKKVMDALT